MADARDAKHEREFREALFAFHHDAKRQLEQCASKAEEAKEAFKDLARYFGEDVAKISFAQEPERFAGVVKDFADLIEKAQKERAKVEAANKDEEQGAREEKVNDAKKPNATPKEKETSAKTREKASEEKPAAAKKKPAINVQDVFDDIKRGAGMASLRKTGGGTARGRRGSRSEEGGEGARGERDDRRTRRAGRAEATTPRSRRRRWRSRRRRRRSRRRGGERVRRRTDSTRNDRERRRGAACDDERWIRRLARAAEASNVVARRG